MWRSRRELLRAYGCVPMSRVAVVGSRDFPDMEYVRQYVEWLHEDSTVVSGGARGVDRLAVDTADQRGLTVDVVRADWDGQLGKLAGKDRNYDIILRADKVVAFWDGWSNGTAHAIALAAANGNLARVVLPGDVSLATFRTQMLAKRAGVFVP